MLTAKGVPWEVVMDLDDVVRRGMCIAAGMNDGGEYDWNARKWVKQNG